MKTFYIIIIAVAFTATSGILFYNIGYRSGNDAGFTSGYASGQADAGRIKHIPTIEELTTELKRQESENIIAYLNSESRVRTIDEGDLFTIDNVHYFQGTLSNNAHLATAKDVVLEIDFLSKTGAKVGSQKITIYEFIRPQQEIHFKERINLPEKYESFKFYVLRAAGE